MGNTNWEKVTNHICQLGEGPVWDAARQRLLWVDISRCEIHQYHPGTSSFKTFKAPQMVGAIALLEKQDGVVAALQNGFAVVDLARKSTKWLLDVEADLPDQRFNDGKCDPAGRFWAGTLNLKGQKWVSNLYMLDQDHTVRLKIPGVTNSNGLAWSPDHTTFYFIDTPTGCVAAYDFDLAIGGISHKRPVVQIAKEMGKPDGMTIDQEGMLWVALYNGWGVARFNPHTGHLLHQIKLPVARVTSCTFGGSSLTDLYITTACEGATAQELEAQPLAGALFVVKDCGFTGLPAATFKLQENE